MSLQPSPIPPVPGVTACVARAAFPRGNVLMQLRDTLGTIYTDEAEARSVSHAWSTCRSPVAAGAGDSYAIHGAPD